MKRITFVVALILAVMVAAPALAQSKDVDLEAADGTNLKATYTSPRRPGGSFVFGPAMLLIHLSAIWTVTLGTISRPASCRPVSTC